LFSQNPVAPGMSGTGSTGMTQTSATIHDCSGSGCAPVNTTTYFHGDQIGSARLLSAGYGYPVWQGTFTPFGQEVSPELTSNHYKFNGKERGEASEGGLDNFGARSYSSVIGRWMTPDWSDEPSPVPYAKLTDPQSLNLYSFVTDDPLSHTDLDGHFQMAPASNSCGNNNGDSCKPPSCASGTDCHLQVHTVAKDVTYDPKNPNSPITVSITQSYVTTTTNGDGTVTITKALVTTTVTDSDNGQSYSQTVAGKQSITADATTGQTTYGPSTTATRGISENEAARQFTGQGGFTGVLGLQAEMIAARTSYTADFNNNLNGERMRSLEHSEHRQNGLDNFRLGVLKVLEALEHVR
jgi:RHS repeat-associated protein